VHKQHERGRFKKDIRASRNFGGAEGAEGTDGAEGADRVDGAEGAEGVKDIGDMVVGGTTTTIVRSGYVAMLAVDTGYRRRGIGTALAERVVRRMRRKGCSSVTLETEVSNRAAMKLYEERLGFMREELLVRYYLNWGDAYRLRLWFE